MGKGSLDEVGDELRSEDRTVVIVVVGSRPLWCLFVVPRDQPIGVDGVGMGLERQRGDGVQGRVISLPIELTGAEDREVR